MAVELNKYLAYDQTLFRFKTPINDNLTAIKRCLKPSSNGLYMLVLCLSVPLCCMHLAYAVSLEPDASTPITINNEMNDSRSELQTIITGDDYAKQVEVERWQPIPKPDTDKTKSQNSWFQRLIDKIFGHRSSRSNDHGIRIDSYHLIAILFKGMLIAILVGFIIWVLIRASKTGSWARGFKTKRSAKAAVDKYVPHHLSQGWERLPSHSQIPDVVTKLVHAGEYIQAASILYRGGLRWLSKSQALHIKPATTEMQCINQIKHLNQMRISPQPTLINDEVLSVNTKKYLMSLVKMWLQIAYDPKYHRHLNNDIASRKPYKYTNNIANNPSYSKVDNPTNDSIAQAIMQHNDGWIKYLNVSAMSDKSSPSQSSMNGMKDTSAILTKSER